MTTPVSVLERRVSAFSENLALLGLIGLIAVTLAIIADVLMRWLFSAPFDGLNEILQIIYAVILASFFPTALTARSNISIRLVGNWLGPKVAAVLDLFGEATTFAFFAVIAWQFIHFTGQTLASHEVTWVLAWPVGPWWVAVTILFWICLPIQLVVLAAMLSARR